MPDPVTAILGGVSVIGGISQADAAGDAAEMQTQNNALAIAEQRAAREEMRKLLQPYTAAGTPALQEQMRLLGLSGAGQQQQAIAGLENSPMFQAIARQGETAMLQNASATGGLRGGNIQGALGQFRPQLLNQFIEQQYGRLAGLTSLGQQSAAGVGTAGIQTGQNIGNILMDTGAQQAGARLAQGNAFNSMIGDLGAILSGGF